MSQATHLLERDPADVLRRAARTREQVLRAQLRKAKAAGEAGPDEASIYELAAEAEAKVAEELRAAGFTVAATTHKAAYDLEVNGCLRIEVKATRWHLQEDGKRKRGRYQVNLRDCQAGAADLVIVMLRNGKDSFFVIPAQDLAGQHSLTIRCHSVSHYSGKWKPYYNAWELIEPALDAAKRERPQQLGLEVVNEH